MQRWISLIAALGLTGLLAGPVLAAAPFRNTTITTEISCGAPLVGSTGVAVLNDAATFRDPSYGDFAWADVAFWPGLTEPSGDASLWGGEAAGSATDSSIALEIQLYDAVGPAGSATIDAAFVADGPLQPYSYRDHFNLTWLVVDGTEQAIAVVAGTLTIAGDAFDLAGCTGVRRIEHVFATQPNAQVLNRFFLDVHCQLDIADRTVFLDVFGFEQGTQAASFSVNLSVDPDAVGGYGEGLMTRTRTGIDPISTSFDTFAFNTGDTVGTASVSLAFARVGDPVKQVLQKRTGYEKSIFQFYAVSGTIDLPSLGLVITDLSSCEARSEDFSSLITSQQGPKAPKPPNDAPAGAIPVTAGWSTTIRTGGAADGEVATACLDYGWRVETFSKTVWYRVTGTGAPITIDTAGSDFDTVLAVYVQEDLGAGPVMTEVACNDDVPLTVGRSLQASVTVDGTAGVTYWIQAGGWRNEWGRLHISVN